MPAVFDVSFDRPESLLQVVEVAWTLAIFYYMRYRLRVASIALLWEYRLESSDCDTGTVSLVSFPDHFSPHGTGKIGLVNGLFR